MENNFYCQQPTDVVRIELSREAREYLCGTTGGTTNWAIYSELLNLLSRERQIITKRGIEVTLEAGQVECSTNSLRVKFGLGPKPMNKVLSRFQELGLIRRTASKVASVADMVSVIGWENSIATEKSVDKTVETPKQTEQVKPPVPQDTPEKRAAQPTLSDMMRTITEASNEFVMPSVIPPTILRSQPHGKDKTIKAKTLADVKRQ